MSQKSRRSRHSHSARNVTSAELDLFRTAAFIAALFINKQALIPLAGMLITYSIKPHLYHDAILLLLSYAIVYAALSTVYVRIKSEIRQGMILHAALYWLLATDYFLWEYATVYSETFKPLIRALDVYIFYHLVVKGGSDHNGILASSGYRWFYRL